jgi:hypothetical protein
MYINKVGRNIITHVTNTAKNIVNVFVVIVNPIKNSNIIITNNPTGSIIFIFPGLLFSVKYRAII